MGIIKDQIIDSMEKEEFSLNSIVGIENALNMVLNNKQECVNLFDYNFRLADLDISSRVLLDWYKRGLLPDRDITESKHHFSLFELIYLFMVQDLRDIGFPFERIKKFKSFMFFKIDLLAFLNIIDTSSNSAVENILPLDHEDSQAIEELIKKAKESLELLPQEQRQISTIDVMLLISIIGKIELDVIVFNTGSATFEFSKKSLHVSNPDTETEFRIILPIFKYIKKFLSKEKYFEVLTDYHIINEREQYLLQQVRDGKYSSIKIKFGKGKMERLEMTQNVKVDHAARFSDILIKGGYQNIELITQDGAISYAAITDKKKF